MSSAPQPSAQGRLGLWSRQGAQGLSDNAGRGRHPRLPCPMASGRYDRVPMLGGLGRSVPRPPPRLHVAPSGAQLFRPPQRIAPGGGSLHYPAPTRPLVAPVASNQSPGRAGVMPAGPAWGSDLTTLGVRGQQLSWWEERWASLQMNPGFY